jgi:RNA polymerase sigma-70 factor (sigma-E family)
MVVDDDAGFEAFAAAEIHRLVRYATALSGDRELGADLVQDVLCKVVKRWPQMQDVADPGAYAHTMVTRQYLSWRRMWASRNIGVAAGEMPEGPAGEDHAEAIANRDAITHQLAQLPRRQRTVLALRYYEQLTDNEIADELGCSPVTVRGYASRAMASLRLTAAASDLATTATKEIR